MILALETSTPRASLALWDPAADTVLAERFFESDRAHNSAIFAPLAELLAVLGDRPLERIVLGTGPGSYGGVRVGIAVATALGMARQVPTLPWPSIGALAPDAWVVGDARRGHFYTAEVRSHRLVAPPRLWDAAGFLEAVEARPPELELVTADPGPPAGTMARVVTPSAHVLAHIAARLPEAERRALEATAPEPLYLRAPYITTPKSAAGAGGIT
jgi:tRNA threonylcarbamoyladenosine biosynthesis protein TsaB